MKKKLAGELTTEELLENLDNEDILNPNKKVVQHKLTAILDFLSKYNIKSGNSKVFGGILYQLFKFDNSDISYKSFVFQMKKVIPHKKQGHSNNFYINKEALEVSEAVRQQIIKKPKRAVQNRNRKKHVEAFMNYFKLKAGNNAIQTPIIFDLYDRWTYKFKKKKINNQTLSTILKVYLPFYKASNNTDRYFMLSDDIFSVVSERQLKNIKNGQKEKVS